MINWAKEKGSQIRDGLSSAWGYIGQKASDLQVAMVSLKDASVNKIKEFAQGTRRVANQGRNQQHAAFALMSVLGTVALRDQDKAIRTSEYLTCSVILPALAAYVAGPAIKKTASLCCGRRNQPRPE